jgi:hypothetical protein
MMETTRDLEKGRQTNHVLAPTVKKDEALPLTKGIVID